MTGRFSAARSPARSGTSARTLYRSSSRSGRHATGRCADDLQMAMDDAARSDGTVRKAGVDYRMQRRAVLADVRSGLRSPGDVCDAHPDLLRAAIHLGTPTDEPCPLCEDRALAQVTYVFERKGTRSPGGRAIPRESLTQQVERFGELTVYTVEVCRACHWHHLIESFLLIAQDSDVSAG